MKRECQAEGCPKAIHKGKYCFGHWLSDGPVSFKAGGFTQRAGITNKPGQGDIQHRKKDAFG